MSKVEKKPFTALYPVPTVLVTCVHEGYDPNMITIAWVGTMNSDPPMVYVSVRPSRHSHKLIKESGEYTINIPSADLAKKVDYCGTVSGRDTNKFKETGLTPISASRVKAPLIKECPVNLECVVRQVLSLGSHDAFIAEVVAVHINQDVLNDQGRLDVGKAQPYAYCGFEYWLNTQPIGTFGYSGKDK
ncbi:MAG: flavin reductase family protein [Bacillota bacterium]